ncbi:MAG: hypothetical protein M5R36_03785 [Deltaproteobacteria bacterium]|nr:hypothetical protein [Deltaproteobacteria bacterium]
MRYDNDVHDPSERFFFADLDPVSEDLMVFYPEFLLLLDMFQRSLWEGTGLDEAPGTIDLFDPAIFNRFLIKTPLARFVHIDADPIALGSYFQEPRPEDFKAVLVEILECLRDAESSFEQAGCALGGLI